MGSSIDHPRYHGPAGRAVERPAHTVSTYRRVFTFFILLPIPVMFIVPLVFYRVPMVVSLSQERLVLVGGADVARAVAVSLVWLAVVAGLMLWPTATARRRTAEWSPQTMWRAFWVLSIGGSAAAVLEAFAALSPAVSQPVHLLAQTPTLAVLLGVYVMRARFPAWRPPLAVLWTLMALDLVVDLVLPLSQARVGPVVFSLFAILYGLTVIGVPRRRLAAMLLVLVPIVAIMVPVREYLRTRAGGAAAEQEFVQAVDSSDLWRVGLRFHRSPGLAGQLEFGLARLANRLNRLGDLAYVVGTTPRTVPYAKGLTYVPIVAKLVPRALWTNKPAENAGQYYGHRYGFLDPHDTVHSDNLPMITEGWLNFGWLGVVFSAAIFGMLLRVIWTVWIGDGAVAASVLIGAAIVGTASDVESNLSLVVGGIVYSLVASWLIVSVIGAWDRAARPRREARGAA